MAHPRAQWLLVASCMVGGCVCGPRDEQVSTVSNELEAPSEASWKGAKVELRDYEFKRRGALGFGNVDAVEHWLSVQKEDSGERMLFDSANEDSNSRSEMEAFRSTRFALESNPDGSWAAMSLLGDSKWTFAYMAAPRTLYCPHIRRAPTWADVPTPTAFLHDILGAPGATVHEDGGVQAKSNEAVGAAALACKLADTQTLQLLAQFVTRDAQRLEVADRCVESAALRYDAVRDVLIKRLRDHAKVPAEEVMRVPESGAIVAADLLAGVDHNDVFDSIADLAGSQQAHRCQWMMKLLDLVVRHERLTVHSEAVIADDVEHKYSCLLGKRRRSLSRLQSDRVQAVLARTAPAPTP